MRKKCNYRRFLFGLLVVDILSLGILGTFQLKKTIPDTIYIHEKQKEGIQEYLKNPLVTCEDAIYVSENGSYKIPCSLLGIVPLKEVQVQTVRDSQVSVCGAPVGLYMETKGVLIVDTGEIKGTDGIVQKPAENIAKAGDYILKVNGTNVTGKKDLIRKIKDSGGSTMELLINRQGEEVPILLTPVLTEDKNYKLGIWVRDNTQGIGTLTYVDGEGKFGALGHGISDTDTGKLLDISDGELYEAEIVSVAKGTRGTPGELSGYIEYQDTKKMGKIEKNTENGIFGRVTDLKNLPLRTVDIGYKQEVKEGKAQLMTNLKGNPRFYDIEITEIYKDRADSNKAFAIRVTDSELLAGTGGIVQGMSGSPILQDGKLVGAVTHVFVQDSSRGYGIFIENMLW